MEKGDPKMKLEELEDCYVLTISKFDENWSRFNLDNLVQALQNKLVQNIAPKIEEKIFNEVMNKIDVNSIAVGASVRIIQNLGQNSNQNQNGYR